MRHHASFTRLLRLHVVTFLVAAAGAGCDSDPANTPDGTDSRAAATDSLASARTELVSGLRDRIMFALSASPNAPTASVALGAPGDTTFSISITNDTNHIAPRLVLENPELVRELRRVGYRAVSFRDADGRNVVLPIRAVADSESISVAPAGLAGEIARREFADSVASRLRSVGIDARARGADREILFVDGVPGSADVALGYANAVAGGMLSIERLRALRFTRMIVAGPKRAWCWNLAELSRPVACSNDENSEL